MLPRDVRDVGGGGGVERGTAAAVATTAPGQRENREALAAAER